MTDHHTNSIELRRKMQQMAAPFSGLSLTSEPEDIHSGFVAAGIHDRESYLNWVSDYAATINKACDSQRVLRKHAKLEDDYAQACRQIIRPEITRLIEVRRMSRIAAGISRKLDQQDDAA